MAVLRTRIVPMDAPRHRNKVSRASSSARRQLLVSSAMVVPLAPMANNPPVPQDRLRQDNVLMAGRPRPVADVLLPGLLHARLPKN